MQFNVGDLILWKSTEELSTITGYWLDYNKVPYYEIEFYSSRFRRYHTEYVGEERIKVLIEYGSILHFPVR
jgi:predicted metallopeptidase